MNKQLLFLLLGTNLGNKKENLELAFHSIENKIGPINLHSKIYETAAWGIIEQPNFLNQVLIINTELKSEKILKIILNIEEEMGRKRLIKWGERLIDIDILYYGHEQINKKNLVVPHPFLQERRFTLEPLAEIAPDFIHPIFQKTNKVLLEQCPDSSKVILMDN